jgi:hypothetical protein
MSQQNSIAPIHYWHQAKTAKDRLSEADPFVASTVYLIGASPMAVEPGVHLVLVLHTSFM